jgi:hypothetical protein
MSVDLSEAVSQLIAQILIFKVSTSSLAAELPTICTKCDLHRASPSTYKRDSDVVRATHHVTRHNTPIHNILSTTPQFSISQKALGTLPEDDNVMPKHVGDTIHNS